MTTIKNPKQNTHIQFNRIYRLRDAPQYFGMDIHRFNTEVRPYLTEIPIGIQGIGFDVLEMHAWLEHYIACNGRPAKHRRKKLWDAKKYPGFKNDMESGTLTKKSLDREFVKALELARSKKQRKF
ncbi:MAG: hypothetical protein PVI75_05725 [Gammaproteobacteria bacterium]|jgi:hypothetical protein